MKPALTVRLARQVDGLASRMLDAFLDELPVYRRLPREQLEGEVVDICRQNLETFFASLAAGRPPSEQDLTAIRASAARRAAEQIPLDAVLTAYHLGGRIGWDALRAEAQEDEREELLEIAGQVVDYLRAVTSAVASAYLEERVTIYGEQRDARRALVEALLAGEPAGTLAARNDVDLAPAYTVMALRVLSSADERDEGIDGTVAGRRKVRRLDQALAEVGAPGVLSLLNPTGGWVLLPERGSHGSRAPQADLGVLHERLQAAAGAPIHAGVASRPDRGGAADAAREADEVLHLVVELDRPPGAYRVDDVLLDYVLTRPSAASERLAALLAPLESGPDLIATLETYLGADFDRRKAAAALHVHPNTLDYRLRRVGELTGLDVASAQGIQLLGAALTLRRSRTRP